MKNHPLHISTLKQNQRVLHLIGNLVHSKGREKQKALTITQVIAETVENGNQTKSKCLR